MTILAPASSTPTRVILQTTRKDAAPIALCVIDACRALGIGRTLLYKLIRAGRIESILIGDRRLILRSEIERFVADRLSEARAPARERSPSDQSARS